VGYGLAAKGVEGAETAQVAPSNIALHIRPDSSGSTPNACTDSIGIEFLFIPLIGLVSGLPKFWIDLPPLDQMLVTG
jgi:hypothetical protein